MRPYTRAELLVSRPIMSAVRPRLHIYQSDRQKELNFVLLWHLVISMTELDAPVRAATRKMAQLCMAGLGMSRRRSAAERPSPAPPSQL